MSEDTTNKFSLVDLPESADNALKNLTDEPTQNIGKTIGDVWYLVFGGISHAADKKRMRYATDLKKYQSELDESINQIPEDKKVEPSIQVAAQALENSKYCISSEELRKLFVNLISHSMNADYEQYVHPSFSEIIKQMSPLDAEVLQYFKTSAEQAIVNYKIQSPSGSKTLEEYVYFSPDQCHQFSYAASISSLVSFGLLTVNFLEHFTDNSYYEIFENFPLYHHFKKTFEDEEHGKHLVTEKGVCALTPLGKQFVKACLP